MEAIAYQALVEGVCTPVCGIGPPEPCPSGQPLPTSLHAFSMITTSCMTMHAFCSTPALP